MNKILMIAVSLMIGFSGSAKAQDDVKIGKQNIKLTSDLMTPEALWAMGRIGTAEASADGSKIVYQIGYYSVKANKSQQKIAIINADGTGNTTLTTGTKSETDPTWYQGKIAFLTGGQLWTMNADGTDRKQISKTSKDIEGFKFSPDGSKVILLHSIDFNDIIQKNPDDLPKATGRLVTDLMYRHWDHYVESIQHPYVYEVNSDGIAANGTDILEGEPYECPMEPFGGMEQLAWSPDSKSIAYTCRKKTGLAYSISTDSDIYIYKIGTRETKNLCKPEGYVEPEIDPTITMKYQKVDAKENLANNVGYDTNPQFSPDGQYIAWLSMERNGYEADRNRLCCYNLATGEKKYLTESFDSNVDAFVWSDNKDAMIYFIGVWHATENLYAVNREQAHPRPVGKAHRTAALGEDQRRQGNAHLDHSAAELRRDQAIPHPALLRGRSAESCLTVLELPLELLHYGSSRLCDCGSQPSWSAWLRTGMAGGNQRRLDRSVYERLSRCHRRCCQ